MHEAEMHAAKNKMTNVTATESFLIGQIDENKIEGLKKEGLIIQLLEEKQEQETPGKEPARFRGLTLRMGRRPKFAELPTFPDDHIKPEFYLIGITGPLVEEWRTELERQGIKLLEYIPKNSYTAKLTTNQISILKSLPFIRSVRIYGPEDTGPILLKRIKRLPSPVPMAEEQNILTYDIRLHQAEDLETVRKWLKDRGVNVAGAIGQKIRIYLLEESPLADEIAQLPEIAIMEEYIPPKLHNDVSRILLGIDRAGAQLPTNNISLAGDGQIVAIADTGLDDKHPDFQNRIVGIVARGRVGDSSDPHGHGTHVAGSVLGDGAPYGNAIRGTAPKAKLFFQSLLDSEGGLGGLPLNLGDLFDEAYQTGARIHSNSWGSATGSEYTINSIEVDEFVANHRDMLIVISAGNEGQAVIRNFSKVGYVDFLSIGSPASCKNALTVGASRSNRASGGFSQLSYGQAWPTDFPDPPISLEKVSGNSEAIAAFSSRGPCLDHRIKPDIVAPGTDIVSTKSSRAPLRNFWGSYPGNPNYAYMGGTSMAAPLVAGCAALVREYYKTSRFHDPSAALVKATLINSARWLTGQDSKADYPLAPNFHQGFGCIYMPWAIPNPSEPELKLEFLDIWKDPRLQLNRSGQRLRYKFSILGNKSLRFCLTWTDLPARALQNNLNLFIQHMQTGKKWIGNEYLPMSLKVPDPDNNVEIIRIDNPQAGDYLIQISATNLLRGPQDFALVVTGDLSSQLGLY